VSSRLRGNRRSGGVLIAILAAGACLRIWFALTNDGIDWPDEIYQSLEPAHRLVFGYGLLAWEYVQGARTWALPGVIAGVLKGAVLAGWTEPAEYLRAVRLACALIGVATAWGSYRLARSQGADRFAAACGTAFFSLAAPAIYFSPRAFSDTISTLPVVFGLALLLPPAASDRRTIIGASLLGLAVIVRLHNALFCIGAGLLVAARRDRARTVQVALVFFIWAIAYGVLDRLTWGRWFQSAITYIHFTAVQGRSSEWGVSPATYYVHAMWTSMGLLAVAAGALALLAAKRAGGLVALTAGIVLIYSLIPHKEFRFLFPVLPLMGALAGVGLDDVFHRTAGRRGLAWAILLCWLGLAVSSSLRVDGPGLKNLSIDVSAGERSGPSDESGSVNRLLLAAYHEASICGLHIETSHWAWTGGYSYLHRRVPIYDQGSADPEHFNYVIARAGSTPAGTIRAADGPLVLMQVRDACSPDPSYRWER
jgi:hypothetical protein